MRIGKMDADQLATAVLSKLQPVRDEVILRPGIGEDCAALNFSGDLCVVSTDPVTVRNAEMGRIAVHINCNDVAASGAEPVAILVTILAPPSVEEGFIGELMEQVVQTAGGLGVEIIGGHTEITDAVERVVISGTCLGRCPLAKLTHNTTIRPSDSLVVTKYIGIEGTVIIGSECRERAISILSLERFQEVEQLSGMLSVVPEGRIGAKHGVKAMHDITEGGVLGAVYEICFASGCGAAINEQQVPVLPVTLTLCKEFALDPLRLISSGSMLMATDNPQGLIRALEQEGIPAVEIGHALSLEEGFTVACRDGVNRPFSPPKSDEIYKLF